MIILRDTNKTMTASHFLPLSDFEPEAKTPETGDDVIEGGTHV